MSLDLIERTVPLKPWMENYEFILIQSIEHLEIIINKAIQAELCAFDLESTGLDTRVFNGVCKSHVVGYSISFEDKRGYYIPIRHTVETDRGKNLDFQLVNPLIQKLLLEAKSIVGQNWLKFDAEMLLASEKIVIRKINGLINPDHDTYILARLQGKEPAGLKYLAKTLLDKEMLELTDILPKGNMNFASVTPYEGVTYASSDAICTRELFLLPEFQKPIKEQTLIYNIERKVMQVVRKMERNKVKLNLEFCHKLDNEMITSIKELEDSIYSEVEKKTEGQIKEFQLDSPDEVSKILFEIYDMVPKPEKGKKGNYTTDDETLEKLAPRYPIAKKLQDYRTVTKFHRSYIKNMLLNVDEEGYLKFNYAPLKTDSGRFASPGREKEGIGKGKDGYSGVNIQATPARYDKDKPNVRKCISCEDDELIAALDWSGVEIRVGANMSGEPIWIDRFVNGDGDVHNFTASVIFDKPEKEIDKDTERPFGKCVHPDSLVYVNGQYIRIGNIHQGREVDIFYNLPENKYVIRNDLNSTANIKQFYSNGINDILLVCSRRGVVACSKNHSFELENGNLVKAKNLKKGMILKEISKGTECEKQNFVKEISFNPFLKKHSENKTFFIKFTEELAYFIGLFLGAGSCSGNEANIISGRGVKNEFDYELWREKIKELVDKLGFDANNRKDKEKNLEIYLGSRYTLSILQRLEVVTEDCQRNLIVPLYIMNNSFKIRLNFLAGLFDTDGTVGKSGTMDVTTKYWRLAQDVCVLLASCNVHYNCEVTWNKKYKKNYFRIRLPKKHNKLFREYMKCPWKLDRLSDPEFSYKTYPKNAVTKIMTLEKDFLVDIGIDNQEHMYLVNNFRTHNTFNFQTLYGGGPGSLAAALNISFEDAKKKQEKYFGRMKTIKSWIKIKHAEAEKTGYCLTQFGRKRLLPQIFSEDPRIKAGAQRQSINTPIQGSSADLLKLAMIQIDKYIEDNKLEDVIQMLITMHDELVFRVKKDKIDIIDDIANVMKLDSVIKKVGWKVPLAVDVEIGSSWDVEYEYKDMLSFLKEKKGIDKVAHIYTPEMDYDSIFKEFKIYKKEKKEGKKEITPIDHVKEAKKEFKDTVNQMNLRIKEEEVSSIPENSATSKIDNAFAVLKNVSLQDLPEDAYFKLKKNFYEKEIERLLSGDASIEDKEIEFVFIVHTPIDDAKKNMLGFIIDSCPGNGKVKFLSQDKEELHEDWLSADILKMAVLCKIFNL